MTPDSREEPLPTAAGTPEVTRIPIVVWRQVVPVQTNPVRPVEEEQWLNRQLAAAPALTEARWTRISALIARQVQSDLGYSDPPSARPA